MAAKERALGVITWTLERAGPGMDGWYYGSTENDVDLAEGDRFTLLHVLHQEVGILGIFSDWPATSTFYANCMGINLRLGADQATVDATRANGGDEDLQDPQSIQEESEDEAVMRNGGRK